MPIRTLFVALSLFVLAGFLGFQLELTLPTRPPDLAATYTPITQAAPSSLGSYDVLGHRVSQADAAQLLQTEAGQQQLSPNNAHPTRVLYLIEPSYLAITQKVHPLKRVDFFKRIDVL